MEANPRVERATIWRERRGVTEFWATEIPPSWNTEQAYSIPGDPDSDHVGIYGYTTWDTYGEARDAVCLALAEYKGEG